MNARIVQLLSLTLLLLGGPARGALAQDPDGADPAVVQEREEEALKEAVRRVAPSVVRIETIGGLEQVRGQLVGTGPTTGLVVDEEGYILSSAFNFAQLPPSILVTLPDGTREAARVVARDRSRMLVLLKVDADRPLTVPQFVQRDQMRVGQWAVAVGRTYSLDAPNTSVGIVSALNRIWGKALQTDARISPSNYGGPLVDIQGRVLGILVPLSPQGQDELAGAEWYDSGIGFAIPLADIIERLEVLKSGEDLLPGLLGASLKSGDMFADVPEIVACQPKSPAYEAGLQAGDRIVEVDGQSIFNQAQLRHALGARYAGDTVRLAVERGEDNERIEVTLELAATLDPYEHPFLGLLPASSGEEGVTARYVYPDSPAAAAGMQAGDRVVAVGGEPIADAADLRARLAALEPGDSLSLEFARETQSQEVTVELSALPETVPDIAPRGVDEQLPEPAEAPETGVIAIDIPEDPNDCFAYVPENFRPDRPHGLLVWLHAPNGFDQDEIVSQWKDLCAERHLILLAPRSGNPSSWVPTEREFILKTMNEVMDRYPIDSNRIAVHGYQAGGAMAYLLAFSQRDLIRGVAAVDAPLPRRLRLPPNDPVERLSIYTASSSDSRLADAIAQGLATLREARYPVIERVTETPRNLDDAERAELARWVDTLDRF